MARVVPDTLVAKGLRVARPGFEIRFLVVCQRFAGETAHKQSRTKGPCCACQGAGADCLCRRHFVRHCDGQERKKRPAGLQIPKARELDGKLAGFREKLREPAVCGEQENEGSGRCHHHLVASPFSPAPVPTPSPPPPSPQTNGHKL